ncbi:Protein kinase alk2 [Orbilia brochopaga]|uniref:Protein kinase alk2 n=1 Tax=Orbilia brochopaga TaxID=3140254 RepID=A0AAV9UX00_9PEZI
MLHWLVLASVSLVGYYIYTKVDLYQRENKFKAKKSTQWPPLKAGRLPFGLDIYSVIMWNFENQSLPEWARSESLKWGNTYAVRFLGTTSITTSDPVNIKAILTSQFHEFGIGPPRIGSFRPLLGQGIFSIDGPGWEHSRALLRPQFTREQITQLENMEEHINIMMDCIPSDGTVVDLQVLFFELTIDTATHFLFGESCETLRHRRNVLRGEVNEIPVGNRFARAFDLSQRHIINRYRLRKFYYMHNPQEFKESNAICHEFVDKYVHQALQQYGRGFQASDEKSGKERYVFLKEIAKETQDPIVLRDALMNVLLAGRDTTASLLSFIFYLLVRHPEAEQKLRAAIQEDFGENDGELLTFEGLKKCEYLRYVINETLRLYPVVPFNVRAALQDTTLPTGGGPNGTSPIFVPKGTSIEYSVYSMHRREDIWGPDSNCFRPERWVGRVAGKDGHSTFGFLPFNGGPRICLGQQFAITEASYAIVRLFQRFTRFESAEPNPFMKLNATLTMCVGGKGVLVKCYKD